MLFPEEHSGDLKKWIVKRLENTSDADADVLADYVLALLRHDGNSDKVRKLCEDEIPDFLKEDSTVFVNDVFNAIAGQSYLPGAPPRPVKQAAIQAPHQPLPAGGLSYDDYPMPQALQPQPQPLNGSRKRGYNEWGGDAEASNSRDGRFQEGRRFKQARRGRGNGMGGRAGRMGDENAFTKSFGSPPAVGAGAGAPASAPAFAQADHLPPPPVGGGNFDPAAAHFSPNAAMEMLFGIRPMSLSGNPGVLDFSSQARGAGQQSRRRPRCRDYDSKGYCARGSTCNFEHGDESLYAHPPLPRFSAQSARPPSVEEYDPTNALIASMLSATGPVQQYQPPTPDEGHQARRKTGTQPKGRRKAPFSADGPVFDRTKSTIVVENIPEENFTEEQVREYFSQFGNILEVSMQAYKRLALVKFDTWASANAAWKSPKSVFDNRFVKIFWHKEDAASQATSLAPNSDAGDGPKKAGSQAGNSVAGAGSPGPPAEIDMEEFLRRQEEAQKIHDEKAKKLQEVERQRQELEKLQQRLLARQREEKARLEAKLAKRARSGDEAGSGVKSESNDDEKAPNPTSQTEALRAQLALLEAEAKQLGLDPDDMGELGEVMENSMWNSSRGGAFARGRGGYSPARGYAPRGFRGGAAFRGGRGNHHAAYAAYSLDNRPKKVTLTGMDFTVSEKDETLRQYLFGVGEFTDIQSSPNSTEITFKDRKTAEKFFAGVASIREIPGLDGQVELSWSGIGSNGSTGSASIPGTPGANSGAPRSSTSAAIKSASFSGNQEPPSGVVKTQQHAGGNNNNHDNNLAKLENQEDQVNRYIRATSGSDKDVTFVLERKPGHSDEDMHAEMDYEVADDNQWE
ncbi:hypothetical protein B0T26DRAFT_739541 [Lasiosphaeria miniovina]|uniref:RNA-binding protein n=1 Tax=Lasiosphaeria miniovina TaxID=1954250 RepID=A0AA40E0A1_9PEZI|nr:uncharacterized protein B0T26DRAFT_739541 [Lasiosphaeria miniovina]KAK0722270.1 hypothetical protein B0T26DRAFT_739541 [Lasiosphaeria miniovina]